MGITSSNKVVDRSEVGCDGEFQVPLALTAAPDITENPTDIVLVLDRSGSMSGVPLAAQGRIIQLEVTVKDVCPNRRVALGVMLEEVGPDGKTEPRGFKAYTIPAHTQPGRAGPMHPLCGAGGCVPGGQVAVRHPPLPGPAYRPGDGLGVPLSVNQSLCQVGRFPTGYKFFKSCWYNNRKRRRTCAIMPLVIRKV